MVCPYVFISILFCTCLAGPNVFIWLRKFSIFGLTHTHTHIDKILQSNCSVPSGRKNELKKWTYEWTVNVWMKCKIIKLLSAYLYERWAFILELCILSSASYAGVVYTNYCNEQYIQKDFKKVLRVRIRIYFQWTATCCKLWVETIKIMNWCWLSKSMRAQNKVLEKNQHFGHHPCLDIA